jgi:hypothetical protein
MASSINSLFSNYRRIFFSLLKRSWKAAPLLFILMTRSRPPNLPPLAYPKERFYRQPSLHFIFPTRRTPQHTTSVICRWHRHSCSVLANWHHSSPAHPCNVHIASLFYQMETSSQYSQNRGHFLHSTPPCSPSTSPLPTHCNPVELTSPTSRSPTRPQTPIHQTFNPRNT